MALNLSNLLVAVVLVGVGCTITYAVMRRVVKRAVSELQLKTDQKLAEVTEALHVLEVRAESSTTVAMAAATSAAPAKIDQAAAATAAVPAETHEAVTPEMLVVIAAAVTTFLGKKVRIRSAKMLQSPYEIVNPWSQQGRVFVQASHNLRSRG